MAVCLVVPEATRFASPREELHRVWRRVTYVYKSRVTPHNKYNNSPGIRREDQLLIVQVVSCVIFIDTHLRVTIDSPCYSIWFPIPASCASLISPQFHSPHPPYCVIRYGSWVPSTQHWDCTWIRLWFPKPKQIGWSLRFVCLHLIPVYPRSN